MNTPLREEMLQICTYHSDDGTSGYLITPEQADQILSLVASKMPEKKELEVEQPTLNQGSGDGSAPFFCSACGMSELKIMERKEDEKYYCACSYWDTPHNAFLDRSGGNWLGWKNKKLAQDFLDSMPIEENGWNAYADSVISILKGGTE